MNDCYITCRIMDACLRENVFGICDNARVVSHASLDVENAGAVWLQLQVGKRDVLLSVHSASFMQAWRTTSDHWLEKQDSGEWEQRAGFELWLRLLATDEDKETINAIQDYCQEANTAVLHRKICQQAYNEQATLLSQKLSNIRGWENRLLFSEQVAAFQDHPFYPTARAKFGFSKNALCNFAPEFAPRFQLRWLAVERHAIQQNGATPKCWPSFSDVGLPADFASSYQLLPVHPLTWESLDNLPEYIIKTTIPALWVRPTLSVRTVVAEIEPQVHIKVPLTMRTLGNKNERLIKSSTLYDGHLLSQILMALEKKDPFLSGKYQHCNEQIGAHVGDDKRLAYIVRLYPQSLCNNETTSLVPVAALASDMPDGRLYLQHLIDEYYRTNIDNWLNDYLRLILGVHMRLWLKYGIALESNQQNTILVFDREQPLTLLMKDNDSARIWSEKFSTATPSLSNEISEFVDKRILVKNELPLAQMFTTITLQLNIAAIFEAMINKRIVSRESIYRILRDIVIENLGELANDGCDVDFAKDILLNDEFLYVKYLLSAGSLMTKQRTGAEDINKFYGKSAPNFLRGQ